MSQARPTARKGEQAGRAKSGAQTGEASQTVTEAGVQKAHGRRSRPP